MFVWVFAVMAATAEVVSVGDGGGFSSIVCSGGDGGNEGGILA